MKLYGRSRGIGYKGTVYDEDNFVVRECTHLHVTRSSAETCGKRLVKQVQKEQRAQNQDP